MTDDKCLLDPQRDCLGLQETKRLEADLNELRRQNAGTHERFGARIGKLESHAEVQDVKFETIIDKLGGLSTDMRELKDESKEVNRQLPALSHKVESLKALDDDVDALKEKPGKRWESLVGQIIGLVVAALAGAVIARLGF